MSSAPNSSLPTPGSSLPAGYPLAGSLLSPSGRPRTLDNTKQGEICALVASGCSFKDAARYVGCHADTIRREARRDSEFARRLRHAQREAELAPLSAIRHAAKRSWRAGAWLMERADAERFATKNARRVTITQLKQYNASLVRILKLEVRDRMLGRHLTRLFNEVLDHCVYKIAAGRDPFPIPPEITRTDSWLPTPPRAKPDSVQQPTPQQPPPHHQ